MSVADSAGRGQYRKYQTSSLTTAIKKGYGVEFDGSGDIILPTTTPVVDNWAGVVAQGVKARTTASKENIVVQRSGETPMVCGANSAFSPGNKVRLASAGLASTIASATTVTATALAAVIGEIVEEDATTTGTTVIVDLK